MATQVVVEPVMTPTVTSAPGRRDFGSSARLWGGFFGRAWLWFVAGCLVVTFVPMLFGWRPYVVESGSMQPRIKVGDVILSSPEHDAKKLLGHVTVFADPDASRAGTVKSHRVVKINPDGTLVTKGDANPTVDPTPVPMSDVKGIGRLLVRWVGLPLIWVQNGAWLKLALLVLTLWVAAVLVVRDHDEPAADNDDETDPGDDDGLDDDVDGVSGDITDDAHEDDVVDDDGVAAPLRWKPRGSGWRFLGRSGHRRAASKPALAKMVGVRTAVVTVTAGALLLPTTTAAFSATTANTGSAWATAASFAPPVPQLKNGDFESGTTYWTGTCASSTSNPTPHGGSKDLAVTANPTGFLDLGQGTATCSQQITLTPNTSYTVTAYVYGTGVTLGVSGGATKSQTLTAVSWQPLTLSFTTGANGTVTIYIQTTTVAGGFLGLQQVTNTVYSDDFSVTSP